MAQVLKEVFGDTKRIRILEELIENWGEFLTIEEIARITETSKKTTYYHINELKAIGILEVSGDKPKRFKLKEDDKRALSLAILESEEYIRKTDASIKQYEQKEMEKKIQHKRFFEYFKSKEKATNVFSYGASKNNPYQLIGVESK